MKIVTLLFGHYRDVAPEGKMVLELPEGATIRDAAAALARQNERLQDLLAHTRYGVNAEFADADTVLNDGDELAFLPPMSGG